MTILPAANIPLNQEYPLLDFLALPGHNKGALIKFSEFILASGKEVRSQFIALPVFSKTTWCENSTGENHLIECNGLDHAAHWNELFKFRGFGFPRLVFCVEVLQNASPLFNKTEYKITVLSHDYFGSLKTTEDTLNPCLPKPIIQYIIQYIS